MLFDMDTGDATNRSYIERNVVSNTCVLYSIYIYFPVLPLLRTGTYILLFADENMLAAAHPGLITSVMATNVDVRFAFSSKGHGWISFFDYFDKGGH